MSQTMKAVQIHAFGGREQLELQSVARPEFSAGEVLVEVKAAGVNPVDWKVREGYLAGFIDYELPLTLGWDFAGVISEVGADVHEWKVGDEVYSRPNIARNGAYAEFIAVDASEIARKPKSLDWQRAAAVPLAALTAWQALYEIAQLKQGDRVLIHAGAGGVGGFAVQLAKLRGAYVYTTSSASNIDYLKSLGVDEAIDYNAQDFSELKNLNVVLDTIGAEVQEKSFQTLVKGGCLVSIISPPDAEKFNSANVRGEFCFVQPNAQQLRELAELIDAEKIRVEVDSIFSLADAAKAHERSESGRARGKIVLSV